MSSYISNNTTKVWVNGTEVSSQPIVINSSNGNNFDFTIYIELDPNAYGGISIPTNNTYDAEIYAFLCTEDAYGVATNRYDSLNSLFNALYPYMDGAGYFINGLSKNGTLMTLGYDEFTGGFSNGNSTTTSKNYILVAHLFVLDSNGNPVGGSSHQSVPTQIIRFTFEPQDQDETFSISLPRSIQTTNGSTHNLTITRNRDYVANGKQISKFKITCSHQTYIQISGQSYDTYITVPSSNSISATFSINYNGTSSQAANVTITAYNSSNQQVWASERIYFTITNNVVISSYILNAVDWTNNFDDNVKSLKYGGTNVKGVFYGNGQFSYQVYPPINMMKFDKLYSSRIVSLKNKVKITGIRSSNATTLQIRLDKACSPSFGATYVLIKNRVTLRFSVNGSTGNVYGYVMFNLSGSFSANTYGSISTSYVRVMVTEPAGAPQAVQSIANQWNNLNSSIYTSYGNVTLTFSTDNLYNGTSWTTSQICFTTSSNPSQMETGTRFVDDSSNVYYFNDGTTAPDIETSAKNIYKIKIGSMNGNSTFTSPAVTYCHPKSFKLTYAISNVSGTLSWKSVEVPTSSNTTNSFGYISNGYLYLGDPNLPSIAPNTYTYNYTTTSIYFTTNSGDLYNYNNRTTYALGAYFTDVSCAFSNTPYSEGNILNIFNYNMIVPKGATLRYDMSSIYSYSIFNPNNYTWKVGTVSLSKTALSHFNFNNAGSVHDLYISSLFATMSPSTTIKVTHSRKSTGGDYSVKKVENVSGTTTSWYHNTCYRNISDDVPENADFTANYLTASKYREWLDSGTLSANLTNSILYGMKVYTDNNCHIRLHVFEGNGFKLAKIRSIKETEGNYYYGTSIVSSNSTVTLYLYAAGWIQEGSGDANYTTFLTQIGTATLTKKTTTQQIKYYVTQ